MQDNQTRSKRFHLTEKTKDVSTEKQAIPSFCKIKLDDEPVEAVCSFKFIGTSIKNEYSRPINKNTDHKYKINNTNK